MQPSAVSVGNVAKPQLGALILGEYRWSGEFPQLGASLRGGICGTFGCQPVVLWFFDGFWSGVADLYLRPNTQWNSVKKMLIWCNMIYHTIPLCFLGLAEPSNDLLILFEVWVKHHASAKPPPRYKMSCECMEVVLKQNHCTECMCIADFKKQNA